MDSFPLPCNESRSAAGLLAALQHECRLSEGRPVACPQLDVQLDASGGEKYVSVLGACAMCEQRYRHLIAGDRVFGDGMAALQRHLHTLCPHGRFTIAQISDNGFTTVYIAVPEEDVERVQRTVDSNVVVRALEEEPHHKSVESPPLGLVA